jgi:PAS domain S-box-containing protein
MRTRFVLCLLLFLYSFLDPHINSRTQLWILIALYVVFNFCLRLFFSPFLHLKRVRMIPALADVVFISLIILNSTGPGNSWFLFYLFPIIDVSRYFGYRGIFAMSLCSIGSYLLVYLISPEASATEPRWFVMRCVVLFGVAAVTGNLARTRHKELRRLIEVNEEIAKAILSELTVDQILNITLAKSLEFTNSGAGHIGLLSETTGEYEVVTSIGNSEDDPWISSTLADELTKHAVQQRDYQLDNNIPKRRWYDLRTYFGIPPKPQSALFVPFRSRDGVIAVYSDWNYHYGKIDIRRLKAFAPLIEMALKTDESAERLKRLTEAESYYRELIDNAPDPIIVLDKDGKIVVFNKACQDLWNYTYEEVAGQPVTNYYESEAHAREVGKLLWQSKDHRKENFEARIKAKNGEIIPISLSACFVEKDGKRDRDIGVFKDRRQAIKMEEKVLQAIAGTVGHDIKHNIATALNYLNALLYDCDLEREPDLHSDYTIMTIALQEAVAAFDKLLTHQPRMPQKKRVWTSEIFRKVETRTRLQILDKNVKFAVNYPEPDLKVSVDLEQIEGVLSNLFTNSLHAIEARKENDASMSQGLIELSVECDQTDAQLIWKDNGCGISEKDHSTIFNAFVTTKGEQGTGLGLFIVKSIIQKHGGRIELESKLGAGATFRIFLPLPKTEPEGSAESLDY